MIIERTKAATPHMTALAHELSRLHSQCVGCPDCRGFCMVLIDALVVPGVILRERPER